MTFTDNGLNIPGFVNGAVNRSGVATCATTLGVGAHTYVAFYSIGTTNSNAVAVSVNEITGAPREVPEGETLLLFGGGVTWLCMERGRRKRSWIDG